LWADARVAEHQTRRSVEREGGLNFISTILFSFCLRGAAKRCYGVTMAIRQASLALIRFPTQTGKISKDLSFCVVLLGKMMPHGRHG